MSVLSGATIREMVESGEIAVDPEPTEEQFQPASLDIRLGRGSWNPVSDEVTTAVSEVEFKPGIPYIGHSLDWIGLPDDLCALMTGRSSVGRKGVVVHKTAGFFDPGFEGQATLEVYNFSLDTQSFGVGERVAQLVFLETDRPTGGYDGQYQGQSGVVR